MGGFNVIIKQDGGTELEVNMEMIEEDVLQLKMGLKERSEWNGKSKIHE